MSNSDSKEPYPLTWSCQDISMIPSFNTLNLIILTFSAAIGVAYIAQKNSYYVKNNIQYLFLLPVVISFSGNMSVRSLTQTLLLWGQPCYSSIRSKWLIIFKQVFLNCLMTFAASVFGSMLLYYMGFRIEVLVTMIITLQLTVCMSSFLGAFYPMVIHRISTYAMQHSGTFILLTNDLLATLLYFMVIRHGALFI